MEQSINIANFKINNQLFVEFDIYHIEENELCKGGKIIKKIEEIKDNVIVRYNDNMRSCYILCEKDSISKTDVQNCFSNALVEKIEKPTKTGIVEINLILLLYSNKLKVDDSCAINGHYSKILEKKGNQVSCLYCRFMDTGTKNEARLSYGVETYTLYSKVKDNPKYKKNTNFYICGPTTMKEINKDTWSKKKEDELYIKGNPGKNKSSYNRWCLPGTDSQYMSDEFYKSSIFSKIAKYIYSEFKESKYFMYFNFKEIEVERFNCAHNFDAERKYNIEQNKKLKINFVTNNRDELNEQLSKIDLGEIGLINYKITDKVEDGENIIVLNKNKVKDENDEDNLLYNKTQNELDSANIFQHIVMNEKDKITKEKLAVCLNEVRVIKSIKEKDISLLSSMFDNKHFSFYHVEDDSFSKLEIKDGKITEIFVCSKEDLEDETWQFADNGYYVINEETKEKICIENSVISILPNFEELIKDIEEHERDNNVEITFAELYYQIIDYMNSIDCSDNHYKILDEILINNEEINPMNDDIILIKNIRKYFDSKAAKNILKEIGYNLNLKIVASRQSKAFIDNVFPSFQHICFDINNQCYTVGDINSMKRNYPTGILIKKYSSDNPEFIKEILPMMCVSFVRYNQLTMYPFPFKLLREMEKMEKRQKEKDNEGKNEEE